MARRLDQMILRWRGVQAGVAAICVGASILIGLCAQAQDTRQVTEPKIPDSCVQLPAQLRAMNNMLSPADESKLDTERIQNALDTCKPGMAVELKPSSGNNAFLSGPLE